MLYLYVAIGGAFGAVCRYAMYHGMHAVFGKNDFPYATLTVNVLGSLLMGIAIGIIVSLIPRGKEFHAFMVVGALGGFTTFSAFSYESYLLLEKGHIAAAAAYMGGSVLLGVGAFFLGMWLFKLVA